MAKTLSKNNWALFLMILAGIVIGSFIGHLTKDIDYLSWLNYGLNFSIGDKSSNHIVSINLAVLVIKFGLQVKITVGSVIGAAIAVFIYKKI